MTPEATATTSLVPKTATKAGDSATAGAKMAETFDNFLLLLTTQLKNQDPLSPLDTNEFTQQLVSFTGVEQQIATNAKLERLLAVQSGNQLASAVGFLGTEVEYEGTSVALAEGGARFAYRLSRSASALEIAIVDGQGNVVRRLEGETAPGRHELAWDGLDSAGGALPPGLYSLDIRATDAEGQTVSATTTVFGRVTGLSSAEDGVRLAVAGKDIGFEDILGVAAPLPPESTSEI